MRISRDAKAQEVALSLVDGGSADHLQDSRLVVQFFRDNKYPIIGVTARPGMDTTWREELETAELIYREQRDEYLKVRNAWLSDGIDCMAFKSAGIAPSFPYTSDNLDILVRSANQLRAIEILEDLGYIWQTNADEREKILFRKFRGGRCVSAIHLHTWIGWDAEFHEDEAIWARSRVAEDDESVIVPSPEDAILINVAHALYENKRFTLFDLEKIRAHWAHPDLDWAYAEGVARRRGWLDGLFLGLAVCALAEESCGGKSSAPRAVHERWLQELRRWPHAWSYYKRLARSGQTTLPYRVSFVFSKLLYYKKIACDSHDSAMKRASNLAHTLMWGIKQKTGVNPQPGMLVTFSGLDGSGKSTQTDALCSALETCGATHSKVWSRPGCSPVYRAISRRFARPRRAGANETSHSRPAPGNKIGRLLWVCLNVLDLAIVYNVSVRLRTMVGNVVVCDRYTADAEVELTTRLPEDDRLARRTVQILYMLSPKPSLAFFVDSPPDAAARRSAHVEDLNDLLVQRQAYIEVMRKRKVQRVEGTRPADKVTDTVVIQTLRQYFDRFGTLLNGLLLSNPEQLNRIARRLRHRRGAG